MRILEVHDNKTVSTFSKISSRELIKESNIKKTILFGKDNSGKTSLAYMLKIRFKEKGLIPVVINGKEMDKKYLTPFYKLLWVKYLDQHSELVEYASQFDDFHDIFKGKNTINCQADVVRQYIKQGRKSIMEEDLVREFIQELKK